SLLIHHDGLLKFYRALKLLDVTPLSLGIWGYNDDMSAIHQHDMSVMIPRNTPIPITIECNYGTHDDNQEAIDIRIYQGESKKVKDNTFIGSFILDGIPAAPAREETIQIRFNIDANGILNVSGEMTLKTVILISNPNDVALVLELLW
ncbi:heat shock cognate 70 kDa protein-like protein, partial [Tanacetum coccineum]